MRAHEVEVTGYALDRLASVPDVTVYGPPSAEARTGVVSFNLEGVHPHDAVEGVGSIESLLAERGPEVVAVGECGLDYHYDHSPRDVQRVAFGAQVALAHACRLALVIHTREAWDDTWAVLEAEGVPERTVFHCFTGGPDEARRALDLLRKLACH